MASTSRLISSGGFDPVSLAGSVTLLCVVIAMAACGPIGGVARDQQDPSLTTAETAFHPTDTLQLELATGTTFNEARAAAVDPFGVIYVADAGDHVVVKLSSTGAFEARLGGPGSREGEFDEPTGVEATNGLVLFVADANNRRIQRFSRSNAYLGAIPLVDAGRANPNSRVTYRRDDGDMNGFNTGRPISVASSDSKEIYAIDSDRNVVLKWDADLRLVDIIGDVGAGRGSIADPTDLALGPDSQVYVADRGRRGIVVFDQYGSHVRTLGEGRLTDLRAVAVGEESVFVGRSSDVVVYSRNGTFLGVVDVLLDEPVVDLTFANRQTLLVLTPTHLYRTAVPVHFER